jgi:t-SNARE complex subunit (syntaxin)|tara:strand:+ start:5457 stop:5906 length:450 start_codon:yes stop_codon:yes gene_type:complete
MAQLQTPSPKPHPGLFHKNAPQQPDMKSFSEDMSNLNRRLRLVEETSTNIRRALQVTEQNMLSKNKTFSTDVRTITSDISDIKKEIAEIKEKILDLIKELKEAAKRDEVKVLEKYINLWNPVKFVTQNEVEEIVKEFIKKEKKNTSKQQ